MSKFLVAHDDIREWVSARSGNPALVETPIGTGSRVVLQIAFDQYALNGNGNEGPDRPGGIELVDWNDWFAEFDKQKLALRVLDEDPGTLPSDYTFVDRENPEAN